jgi:RNA polymerase sigma-70 factor (ECF subfamily)
MRCIVGTSPDLDDLAQTALERAHDALERFEGRAEIETWVHRVCVRVALNHWRGWRRWLARFALGTDDATEPPDPDADPGALFVREARATRLRALLAKLPPVPRLVVTLIDLEDMPPARVAEILECPEPTVRSRLRKGRVLLEALLAKDPWFADDARGAR